MATTERRVATQLHLPLLWRTSSIVISMQCHAVHPTNTELRVSTTALKNPRLLSKTAPATRTWWPATRGAEALAMADAETGGVREKMAPVRCCSRYRNKQAPQAP